ncbi:MAG: hypothetical protein ACI4D2_04045 [Lachnospiraceae bacterium]
MIFVVKNTWHLLKNIILGAEYSPFDKKYAALADKVKKQGDSLKMETKTEKHSTLEKQELASELKKFRLAQSREEKTYRQWSIP